MEPTEEVRPPGGIRDGRDDARNGNESAASVARPGAPRKGRRIDFEAVNAAALASLPALCARWLPDGRRSGQEWIARNPKRDDRRPGSFKVNLATGRWADFALADARGGDPVSLAAYLTGSSQAEAAARLAAMLGVRP